MTTSTKPTIASKNSTRYSNGSNRGFHNKPMIGRLSLVRYTSATVNNPITPSAVPVRWRRATAATNPTIASPLTRMSIGSGNGKNMSQNESRAPSGRPPYFMSVMNSWLPRNGPIQNADSNTVATPRPSPNLTRLRLSMWMTVTTSAASAM